MTLSSVSRIWHGACISHSQSSETRQNGTILSFADYAAFRILGTASSLQTKLHFILRQISNVDGFQSTVYTAVTELAKNYLQADMDCILKWTVKYGLDTFQNEVTTESIDTPFQKQPVVRDLLFLLEEFLLEYLSQNWDRMDEIFCINNPHDMNKTTRLPLITNRSNPSRFRALRNWQKAYQLAIREIIIKTLGVQRKSLTLSQMFNQLNGPLNPINHLQDTINQPKRHRAPVLLMLGGGMAAGKSTIRELIKCSKLQSQISKDAVVIEADAIKSQNVVYRALKERLGDGTDLSQLVHDFSTSLAEEMLVDAVNQQKDIVFDGTMTWFPFVEQTIKMVRDHKHNYRRGPGYHKDPSGRVQESYWEIDEEQENKLRKKLPYRIEVIGVTCDPRLAVARGIWRRIKTGRSVPIESQLRSHRLFSQNFKAIAKLVDSVTLYHTGRNLTTFNHSLKDTSAPKVICRCDLTTRGKLKVSPEAWKEFKRIKFLNDSANSVWTLYSDGTPLRSTTTSTKLGPTLLKSLSLSHR